MPPTRRLAAKHAPLAGSRTATRRTETRLRCGEAEVGGAHLGELPATAETRQRQGWVGAGRHQQVQVVGMVVEEEGQRLVHFGCSDDVVVVEHEDPLVLWCFIWTPGGPRVTDGAKDLPICVAPAAGAALSYRGAVRRVVLAALGLALIAVVGIGGYLLGAASERPSVASREELEQGLAVTLGITTSEVRELPGFHEATDCAPVSCQLMVSPVPTQLSGSMQHRLNEAGWVLHSHDQPECVSDSPQIRGFVCSYQKGSVTISVQAESTTTPDELAIWASTG